MRLKMFFDRLMVSLPDGEGLFSFGSLWRRQKLMSNRFIKLSTRLGFDDFVNVSVFKFSDSWLRLDRFLSGFRNVSVFMYRDFSLPLPKNGQRQICFYCANFKGIPLKNFITFLLGPRVGGIVWFVIVLLLGRSVAFLLRTSIRVVIWSLIWRFVMML